MHHAYVWRCCGQLLLALCLVMGPPIGLFGCGEAEEPTGRTVVIGADPGDSANPGANIGGTDASAMAPGAREMGTEASRIVLHEVFSGSNCGPCTEADLNIQEILDANPGRYSIIKYQIGSDPYLSQEPTQRRMLYLPPEAETYSIPFVHVDGVHEFHPNEVNDDRGYLQEDFDEFAAFPSYLEMDVGHVVHGQTIDIEVEIRPGGDYPSDTLALFIAIVENVTYNNVGSNGQTEFHHVFKKMLPDENGEPIEPLVAGETVSISRSYTFRGDYDATTNIRRPVNHARANTVEEFGDLAVVAFVQDMSTLQVHQSASDAPDHPMPMGAIEGQVNDPEGTGLADLPVSCCDDELCVNGMTDATGHYRFTGLGPAPRKMEVIGPEGMLDLLYVQEVGPQHASVVVTLIPQAAEAVAWSADAGGTVTVGGGGLSLTAAPGVLEYPLGSDHLVKAELVALSVLPPYTLAATGVPAWAQPGAVGWAYVFNPTHLTSTSPIAVTMNPDALLGEPPAEGAVFDLYTVHPDTGVSERAGTAIADAEGVVSSAPDATIQQLTSIIAVQQPPQPARD